MTIGQDENLIDIILASMCERCPVTQIDQRNGIRPDKEPLEVLKKNRPSKPGQNNKKVTFGMNGVFPQSSWGKILRVGDEFKVSAEKTA
jgi:uncharacterized protein YcbX